MEGTIAISEISETPQELMASSPLPDPFVIHHGHEIHQPRYRKYQADHISS
jgi:hypothetical protein